MIKIFGGSSPLSRRRLSAVSAGLALIALLASSCASSHRPLYRSNPLEESFTLPPFLAGPIAVLLTNANDYSAHVTIDLTTFSGSSRTINGSLLTHGPDLLFSPTLGDRSFIWDESQNHGYILSEALQGYAPIASTLQITNVAPLRGAEAQASDTINGRPCRRSELAISSNDGLATKFIIWRERDSSRFPVRIKVVNGTNPLLMDFSNCRRESLAEKLFQPPDGFTRYATAQSLREELEMRQETAGKKSRREDENGVEGIGHMDAPMQYRH
jgi:hypothetical protein